MNNKYIALTVLVIAAVTALLRFLPFIIFNEKRRVPKIVLYLGRVLPYASMGMLVVYCFKGVDVTAAPFGLPELIAGVSVALLHIFKRNTLLSIIGGTIVYMVLIRFVF